MQEQDRETRNLQHRVRNTFTGKVVAAFENHNDALDYMGDANHLYTTGPGTHPWHPSQREPAPEPGPENR